MCWERRGPVLWETRTPGLLWLPTTLMPGPAPLTSRRSASPSPPRFRTATARGSAARFSTSHFSLIFFGSALARAGFKGPPASQLLPVRHGRSGRPRARRDPRAAKEHLYERVSVNSTEARFRADSGASSIVLTRTDLAGAGFDVNRLGHTVPASIANAAVAGATVTLDSVALADLAAPDAG